MKNLLFILTLIIASNASAQTYPKKVVIEQDTCIIFTLEQSRKLIAWDVELDNCNAEKSILIEESSIKDSLIYVNREIAKKYSDIDTINNFLKVEKDELIKIHSEETKRLEKQIKKFKRQRFLSTTLGVVTTCILTTIILIK